jgi:hypothetical protein
MFPGSMLPPGVQLAATDRRSVPYDNEEDLAQKYGRLIRPENRRRLALVGTPLLVIVALTVFQLIG